MTVLHEQCGENKWNARCVEEDSGDYDVPLESAALESSNSTKPTGIEGIKCMLSHDTHGCPSPQLTMIKETSFVSGLFGTMFGGITHAQDALHKFLRTNQATAFENPHIARRLLFDRVFLGFGKGAWMWGWRLTLFSGSFLFISSAIPAYNGYHSFLDFAGGSALAGMIYKFKHGPKPMMVGGAVGATLGAGAGCLMAGLLSVAGLTLEDIYDAKRRATQRALRAKQERVQRQREGQKDHLSSSTLS
ncbi:Mitochondrial inner membrane translocase subunit Tim17/Tim22/Tim23/peroxisomal protein PMP24 [Trinorchestia longiramus]|nr:Mitochondrial inner membrane translocase subunit Tim17/Tim22/Tim23/peroxisomal protein PMP24 [Trinorchestia longiramus]